MQVLQLILCFPLYMQLMAAMLCSISEMHVYDPNAVRTKYLQYILQEREGGVKTEYVQFEKETDM